MSDRAEHLFPGEGELAQLMRRTDWSATSLGPVESWPNGLRAAVRIVLSSRFSMWMAWGDELAFLYNDAYRRDTLGVKHPRALGMATDVLWSEIWSEIGPRIRRVLREGTATWDEGLLLVLERNGYREETYHTFSYSPLHDDDGNVRGVLSVVTEETARLISERRVALLGRLGTHLAAVNTLEGVMQGIDRALAVDSRDLPFSMTYLFDPSGTELRLVSQTGFPPDHAPPPPRLALDHPWVVDVLASRQPAEIPLEGAWPTGPWDVAASSIYVLPLAQAGQAKPAGVIACAINPHRAFDASAREFLGLFASQLAAGIANARAYETERERAESLAELDRAKTLFFSNVSHELRTPLTLMLGPLADLLGDPQLPAGVRGDLATIQRNGLRLLKLVNTMLDFSRIEAGRATAQIASVDISQLTSDLASVFRAAIEKAGVRYVVDCPPLGLSADVDPEMWEKIVLNLVSNSFKFTLAGEIRVTLAWRDDELELEVRDTGCGIPAQELEHVFDRFHRVEGTRGRSHEGTGIGLALVQELVKLHGGTIGVQSEVDRGTTFTVRIPIQSRLSVARREPAARPTPRAANAFIEEAMRWLPDEAEPQTSFTGPRGYLLIADDNADMRSYMKRLLDPRWEVRTVSNGVEALAAMRERRPDLLVTDVMMPQLDGFGLLAAMRADRELAHIPAIMLSARAGDEARVEGLQAGAQDYLVKPFSSRELVARVESQLMAAVMRRAENEQLRRFATMFEQAPVAMALLTGPDHVFEVANERYRAVVGGRAVLGKTLADALPEVVPQGFLSILDRVYTEGEPFLAHALAIQLQDGAGQLVERKFDLVYQPMFDSDGAVRGIAAIGHDVTALVDARHAAEQANRAKDEFLAMLGHELRNPLAPILTALQLMQLLPNVGADRERAIIERQVKHLVGLVDDLLDVSRITRGKVELRLEAVEIADVVTRSVEQASPLFEQHRHTLTLDVAPGLVVHGDPARLAQIVSNLLTNAAKYTADGGRVDLVAARRGAHVDIRVRDNGIGIERAMLEEIFAPFAQSRQSIERSQGGLGLGLAIVESLVRLHDGQIVAHSDGLGHGSEFVVTLPLYEHAHLAAPPPPDAPPLVGRGGRVLVVDDNEDAAQMLADLLEASGFQTTIAYDGPSAIAKALEFRPEVAVVDLGLPVMDGFELGRRIREDAVLGRLQLVALTGYGQAEDRRRTAAAGFAEHFVKPVDGAALRAAIERLLPSR